MGFCWIFLINHPDVPRSVQIIPDCWLEPSVGINMIADPLPSHMTGPSRPRSGRCCDRNFVQEISRNSISGWNSDWQDDFDVFLILSLRQGISSPFHCFIWAHVSLRLRHHTSTNFTMGRSRQHHGRKKSFCPQPMDFQSIWRTLPFPNFHNFPNQLSLTLGKIVFQSPYSWQGLWKKGMARFCCYRSTHFH